MRSHPSPPYCETCALMQRILPRSMFFMRLSRLFLLPLLLAPLQPVEARVFVSLAGTLLEADIKAVNGDSVTLMKVDDGQTLTINRTTLCKEDNAFISKWVEDHGGPASEPANSPAAATTPAKPASGTAQKYNLSVQALPSKNNRGATGSAYRTFEVTYTFNISSREVTRDLDGAKATIITFGKNAADAGGDLIVLQKVKVDLAVKAQSKATLTTPPIHLSYSSEYRYGVRTHGYALFIEDASGNMMLSESSPEGISKYWKELSTLQAFPCMVDREFKERPGISNVLSYINSQ